MIEKFASGDFAFVMATGIVAIGLNSLKMNQIADIFVVLNLIGYSVLLSLLLIKTGRDKSKLLGELGVHAKAPNYFTVVAGTCVLGNSLIQVSHLLQLSRILFLVGLIFWFVLIYLVFVCLITACKKIELSQSINGGWLLSVVATESLAVLGNSMVEHCNRYQNELFFGCLAFWLLGGFLYIWIGNLLFYRYLFLPLTPKQIVPQHWIDTGAMAIATVAGTSLIHSIGGTVFVELRPFILAGTVLCWAVATWWLPIAIMLSLWKFKAGGFSLHYKRDYWSAVFPITMYGVCSFKLSELLGFSLLNDWARLFIIFGIGLWGIVFTLLCEDLIGFTRRNSAH